MKTGGKRNLRWDESKGGWRQKCAWVFFWSVFVFVSMSAFAWLVECELICLWLHLRSTHLFTQLFARFRAVYVHRFVCWCVQKMHMYICVQVWLHVCERGEQPESVARCCTVISIILTREALCVEEPLNTSRAKHWATALFCWLACLSSCNVHKHF